MLLVWISNIHLVCYLITLELTMYFIPLMPHPLPALPDQGHQHQSPTRDDSIIVLQKTKEGNVQLTWKNHLQSTKFNAVNDLIPLFSSLVLNQSCHNCGIKRGLGCSCCAGSCEFWFSYITIALDQVSTHTFVYPFDIKCHCKFCHPKSGLPTLLQKRLQNGNKRQRCTIRSVQSERNTVYDLWCTETNSETLYQPRVCIGGKTVCKILLKLV